MKNIHTHTQKLTTFVSEIRPNVFNLCLCQDASSHAPRKAVPGAGNLCRSSIKDGQVDVGLSQCIYLNSQPPLSYIGAFVGACVLWNPRKTQQEPQSPSNVRTAEAFWPNEILPQGKPCTHSPLCTWVPQLLIATWPTHHSKPPFVLWEDKGQKAITAIAFASIAIRKLLLIKNEHTILQEPQRSQLFGDKGCGFLCKISCWTMAITSRSAWTLGTSSGDGRLSQADLPWPSLDTSSPTSIWFYDVPCSFQVDDIHCKTSLNMIEEYIQNSM